jgi:hypothetical protein
VPTPQKHFKRLIIDSSTGKFLTEGGGWTTDENEAVVFENIVAVIAACAKHDVKSAEVLLRFREGSNFDLRLPIKRAPEQQRSIPG